MIQGIEYDGLFVILGSEDEMTALQTKLPGASLAIRYDPSDPKDSFIADLNDRCLRGFYVTQEYKWLIQAGSAAVSAISRSARKK